MTNQLCRDCKHLETDGMFGIFCGVGGDNTKYDCPKYAKRSDRMTEKRFRVHKIIGSFHEWGIEDIINDKVVFDGILHKYNAERLCAKLNELHDENKQLHSIIIEDEKMIQSIYEELSKLRLIKKNLREIKNQWNWIMESVDYD